MEKRENGTKSRGGFGVDLNVRENKPRFIRKVGEVQNIFKVFGLDGTFWIFSLLIVERVIVVLENGRNIENTTQHIQR